MDVECRKPSVKVHLVHGTWANGWLKSPKAWFDGGSNTFNYLSKCLPANFEIAAFHWSGKNGVNARIEASAKFASHLQSCIEQNPNCDHLILAHSHGGTVAHGALSMLGALTPHTARVKGLICLSTPFAFLTNPSPQQYRTGMLAVAALLYAIYWSVLLSVWPTLPNLLSSNALLALVTIKSIIPLALVFFFVQEFSKAAIPDQCIAPAVPTFVLRATRDEASLTIGLMQAFNWLSSLFAQYSEISAGSIRRPLTYVGYAIAHVSCLAAGIMFAKWICIRHGVVLVDGQLLTLGLLYTPAVAGLIYLTGYSALALSVGHLEVHRWISTAIEVDVAPPGLFCRLRLYSAVNGSSPLRHGLYESEEVMKDVCNIMRNLICGGVGTTCSEIH